LHAYITALWEMVTDSWYKGKLTCPSITSHSVDQVRMTPVANVPTATDVACSLSVCLY